MPTYVSQGKISHESDGRSYRGKPEVPSIAHALLAVLQQGYYVEVSGDSSLPDSTAGAIALLQNLGWPVEKHARVKLPSATSDYVYGLPRSECRAVWASWAGVPVLKVTFL